MKKKTAIACLISAILVAAGTVGTTGQITAHANSAPPYWRGTTATGAIVTGEQCPIEVEHELLTLDIPVLPQTSYSSQDEFEKYSASVTAEYTFYNPTDMDVEMELAFPFGTRPEYAYAGYDSETRESEYFDDTARYQITADGKAVEREVRHTYQPYDFNVESMYLISDEKREDEFFKPDLPVTRYGYTIDFANKGENGVAHFAIRYNPTRTKILCGNYREEDTLDGDLQLYLYAQKSGQELTFAAAGETPEIVSVTAEYGSGSSWYVDNWKPLEGATVRRLYEEEMTFEEYVDAARPEEIGEVDFYNGVIDLFAPYASSPYYGPHGFLNVEPSRLTAQSFMRWYTYSLKIPAGERLTNSVTAPLYPTVDDQWCEYEYLLSPAQKWAAFGTLDIVINTEYELYRSSLEFTKTETGYSLHREGLPLGELTFTIEGEYDHSSSGWGYFLLFIIVMGVLDILAAHVVTSCLIVGVTLGIVYGVQGSKKKKQNK